LSRAATIVAIAFLRRIIITIITIITSVLLYTKGSTLNRIITAYFVIKLIIPIVNRESNSLLEVRVIIISVA
jgi:hypothetical protein